MKKKVKDGPKVFRFTRQDYADAIGVHVDTIRRASRNGEIDCQDIKSVIAYLVRQMFKNVRVGLKDGKLTIESS